MIAIMSGSHDAHASTYVISLVLHNQTLHTEAITELLIVAIGVVSTNYSENELVRSLTHKFVRYHKALNLHAIYFK